MKYFKLILFSVLVFGFLASGCKKDDDSCSVTVDILEPTANQVLADPSSPVVSLEFSSSKGDIHEFTIQVYPTNDPGDKILDRFETDVDSNIYIFYNSAFDLSSYPSGTQFTLLIETCCGNGTCEESSMVTRNFSIQ